MKNLFLSLMATLVLTIPGFAEEKPATDPKKEEMMKAYQQYATPGAPHKVLAQMTGKWKCSSKWWETAEAKPEESKCTSTTKMIMGGRFLHQTFKGMAMGTPFEGMGITGYDNIKAKYNTIWFDNLGTGIMHGTGNFDESKQTLQDGGEVSCPISEKKTRTYRSEWKIVDKNNLLLTMWGPGLDGKEFKQMEIAYKRAK